MKQTILRTLMPVLCILLCCEVSGPAYAQNYAKVSPDGGTSLLLSQSSKKKSKTVSLSEALEILYKKYQLRIAGNQVRHLSIPETTLQQGSPEKAITAFSEFLKKEKYELKEISLHQYMIIPVTTLPVENVVESKQRTITGTVRDNLSLPLAGVTVRVLGTKLAVATSADGKYAIPALPTDSLEFYFIGYKRLHVLVGAQLHIDAILTPVEGSLEEVTVVGFGKQKKISVVGAVQTVKPEDLRIPSSNLSNSFAGKLAGVVAFQRSGQPGADGSTFYIRGISTFNGVTNPLIILDGVAVSQGDLNALAPEVIESFSILKDATATAIYGSRGANGVMIVTTKTGKDLDKPRINLRMENSISMPTSVPEFADAARFMELYNEAVVGRGTGEIPYGQEKIDGARNGLDAYLYPNVDWYDKLFKPYAMNQTLNANIMGGGKRIDYFMSATVNHDNGILKKFNVNTYDNNISVKRYSFQNNLNANLTPTTKLALKLNAQLRDYHGPAKDASNVFGDVMNANAADFPVMFPTEEGSTDIRYGGKEGGRINSGYANPFAEMVKGYTDDFQSTVLATIDGEQRLDFITKGLNFKALASFKNWSRTNTVRNREYNQYQVNGVTQDQDGNNLYDLEMIGVVQDETLTTTNSPSGDRSLYFQAAFDYNRVFAQKHSVSGLLLYNQREFNINTPGNLVGSLPQRNQGLAGRLTYSYDNRYLTEFNFGYTGSENFAENHRFGFFPSAAVGYVISNEKFWEPLKTSVSLLKLRASWGVVGNDQIGSERFVYLSDINLSGQGYTTGINQNYSRSGPVYLRFANPNITWEVADKKNIGMDLELFGKLNFTIDAFKEHRTGIFLQRAVIPDAFGTEGTNVFGNLGEVENHGFDMSIDYAHNLSPDFQVMLKGTFTFARNKVLANDEPKFIKYKNLSLVGYPVNSLLGYKAERLFIDQAEIDHSPLQQLGGFVEPGDIKYTDVTNAIDGLNMVNSDDRVRMGYPTVPEIVYGFGPSFKYKKLDFSFFFQGISRTSFFINGFHPFGTSDIRNVLQFIDEDHWSSQNPDIYASYPKLSKLNNGNNTANSSFWLRDGSFLKLRNIELGYTYKFARLYLSGYNVLTFSKFKHWDPEQGGGNGLGYPTQRVFNIGLQMGF